MARINGFIPAFIQRMFNYPAKYVVTAEQWNELWSLVVAQGDHNAEALNFIRDDIGDIETDIVDLGALALGTLLDGSIEDIKLSDTAGQIKDRVAILESAPPQVITHPDLFTFSFSIDKDSRLFEAGTHVLLRIPIIVPAGKSLYLHKIYGSMLGNSSLQRIKVYTPHEGVVWSNTVLNQAVYRPDLLMQPGGGVFDAQLQYVIPTGNTSNMAAGHTAVVVFEFKE